MSTSRRDWLLVLLAFIAAASMWSSFGVVDRMPEQFPGQTRNSNPRLTDLYPRWYGTRELLLHGRNPYSEEVTSEIQQSVYGRKLNPGTAGEIKDEQRFAYPLFVIFPLAPTVGLQWPAVKRIFYGVDLLAAAITLWLWLQAFQPKLRPALLLAAVVLYFGSFPVSNLIIGQQPTIWVSALVAAGIYLFIRQNFVISGILTSLSLLKPQLAFLICAWLVFVVANNWKQSRAFLLGLVISVASMSAISEVLLPGWIRFWLQGAAAYARYTDATSMLVAAFGKTGGVLLTCTVLAVSGWFFWKHRNAEIGSRAFLACVALILCCTVTLSPVAQVYDQIFLLPAVMFICQEMFSKKLSIEKRMILGSVVALVASVWIFAIMLATSQLWLRDLTRLSLNLMLFALLPAPLIVLAGLMMALFWMSYSAPHTSEPRLTAHG